MPFLVQIDAYDPVAGAVVAVRAASVDDPALCHLDGQTWWPVIDRLPTLALDFFGGEFGRVSTPGSSISLSVEPWVNFGRYSLPDARLRIWHGDDNASWAGYTLRFDGRVTAAALNEAGIAEIGFAVDDKWLGQPMLATYAGTGGIEGRVEQKGGVKPLALGAPLGVPGVLLDPVKSIFQLSGYGLIEGVDVPLERLARQFGSPVADYADYASLAAATVIAGTWVTAHAIGCGRMGAPPFGRLCFLMRGDKAGPDGWARRPGAIIKRLSQLAGGLFRTHVASLTALDAARPYDLSVFLGNQTDARSPIQSVAASVNAVAGVSLTGELFAIPVQINVAGLTLKADGSGLPAVATVNKLGLSAPWWRQAIGAQPFWDVHGQGDYATDNSNDPENIAKVKTTVFYRSAAPSHLESKTDDTWFDISDGNRHYKRVEGTGRLAIGPDTLTIGGNYPLNPWAFVKNGEATNAYSAALNALAVADSKITLFSQDAEPTGQSLDDAWFQLSTGALSRWNGSRWERIADITARSQIVLAPAAGKIVLCDYRGVALPGQLPFFLPNDLKRGDDRVDALAAWNCTIPTGVTGTIDKLSTDNNRGDIEITAIASDGEILLWADFGGVVSRGRTSVTRQLEGSPPPPVAPGSPVTAAQSYDGQSSSVSTYPAIGFVIGPVRATASGTIKLEALIDFIRVLNGGNDAFGKWRFGTALAGPFTDVAAETQSVASAYRQINRDVYEPEYENDSGSLQVIVDKTGLTSGTDYWFEFMVRKGSTTLGSPSSNVFFNGLKRASIL